MGEPHVQQDPTIVTTGGVSYYKYPTQPPPPYEATNPSSTVITPPTVITAQPGTTIITTGDIMGTKPSVIYCRSCGAQIVTRVEYIPSMRTHLFAAMLCILGCWPFICLPYCIDTCNNVDHYCPNCNSYLGGYRG